MYGDLLQVIALAIGGFGMHFKEVRRFNCAKFTIPAWLTSVPKALSVASFLRRFVSQFYLAYFISYKIFIGFLLTLYGLDFSFRTVFLICVVFIAENTMLESISVSFMNNFGRFC